MGRQEARDVEDRGERAEGPDRSEDTRAGLASGRKPVGVLVVHGMGTQDCTYARQMVEELAERLGQDSDKVAWKAVFWADVLSGRQEAYLAAAAKRAKSAGTDVDWVWARRFVVSALSDAASYRRVGPDSLDGPTTTYGKIHQRVRDGLRGLSEQVAKDGVLVVLAHSLGGHIVSNYIWDVQKGLACPTIIENSFEGAGRLRLLVTFGCNIPLFTFALDKVEPIRLADDAEWLNYYDRDDILGYPLQAIQAYENVCRDVEINVGGFLSSWNMVSHKKYWTDNDFTKPVARSIGGLVRDALGRDARGAG